MFKQSNLLFLLLLLICSNTTHAQENAIAISNFTISKQLSSNVKDWGNIPGTLSLVAQKKDSWKDRPVKLLIAVEKGGNKICGIADGITVDYFFKTRSFQTNDLLAALGNCEALSPGDYTLCVRFRGTSDNRQWVDISTEVCKPFTVGGGSADAQKYERPTFVAPANNKVFTEKETNAPITFRWTPVVPKPQEPVIYHFRVWQVAAGQTPVQAMNSGQPVVEKDVENLTQTNITSGLFPCNPNCQFVCRVQATNGEGKPYGENNGTSELISFNINTESVAQNRNSNIIPPRINPCVPGGPSWNFGGNNFTAQPHPAGITQADVGTCDDVDFILKSNGNAKIWLKGTAGNEYIGVGTEYPNRKLSINGDVSIGLGYNNNGVGSNGIEILGGGQVPIRRGISTDDDPNGHFDFFINNWQSANGIAEFRFKNSIVNNGIAGSSALAPDLMRIDGLGRITINNSNTTLTDKAFTIVNNTNSVSPFDYFTVYGNGNTEIKTGVSNGGLTITQTTTEASALHLNNTTTNGHHWAIFSTGVNNTQQGGAGHFSIYDYNAGADRLFINNTGNVGIGTITPGDKLQVGNTWQKVTMGSASGAALAYGTSYLGFNASRQNLSTWTISSDGVHNGGAAIFGDIGGNIYFSAIPNTGPVDQNISDAMVMSNSNFKIKSNGSVVIGPKIPISAYSNYRLSVDGKIVCKELVVIDPTKWADFVFDKNYPLVPLSEVENFYKSNGHLKDVPSEKEVKENGINLAQMDAILLQKVEELYLYVLEQNKRIEKLEAENKKLSNRKK